MPITEWQEVGPQTKVRLKAHIQPHIVVEFINALGQFHHLS